MSTSDVAKKSKLSGDELVDVALKLIEGASEQATMLRLTGGIAILYLANRDARVRDLLLRHRTAGGAVFADLDLVGYSNETKTLNKLFIEKFAFQKDKIINSLFGDRRRIYYSSDGTYHVDVFLDKLEFNHVIDLRGRLALSSPQLNDADLVLSKLQIHHVNDKDLLDIIALAALDMDDSGTVQRVIDVLSNDWGFWYDATNNLQAAAKLAKELDGNPCLPEATKQVHSLLERLDQSPKTKNWMKGAKRGVKKQWWIEIEDVLR